MKVIKEEVRSVKSMNSGEMLTRIVDAGGGWFEVYYYVPMMKQWKLTGRFLSLAESEIRLNAFIRMHNRVVQEQT